MSAAADSNRTGDERPCWCLMFQTRTWDATAGAVLFAHDDADLDEPLEEHEIATRVQDGRLRAIGVFTYNEIHFAPTVSLSQDVSELGGLTVRLD